MIDSDGYPTSGTLESLRIWDSFNDRENLIAYIVDNWNNGNGYPANWNPKTRRLVLVTGGWSGCEDMIAALEKNFLFMAMYWRASYAGGKHVFVIPKKKPEKRGVK